MQQNIKLPTLSTDKVPMPRKNLAMRLFFRFLQFFCVITLRSYFRRIEIINPEYLNTNGRTIMISNHPNTLIDPLMVLQNSFLRPFLLSNASLFKSFIPRTVLSTLYCIPVKRAKDFDSGFVNNTEIFARCVTHLKEGGSLYVAPEGTSENERHVRPFKKGLAHIYSEAYNAPNNLTDLKILMIGLTYYSPQKPNTDVVIEVGEPFQPKMDFGDFANSKTLDAIRKEVETKFRQLVINCKNADEERFLEKIESLAQSENYLPVREKYFRSKKILKTLIHEKSKSEIFFSAFENHVENYFSFLKKNNLRDVNVNKFAFSKKFFKSLIYLPFSIFGFINNFIPLTLIGILKRSRYFNFESDYYTCVQYVAGFILYPAFWFLQLQIWRWFVYLPHDAIIYFFSVIVCGFLARAEWVNFKKCFNYLKFKRFAECAEVTKERAEIINQLKTWNVI